MTIEVFLSQQSDIKDTRGHWPKAFIRHTPLPLDLSSFAGHHFLPGNGVCHNCWWQNDAGQCACGPLRQNEGGWVAPSCPFWPLSQTNFCLMLGWFDQL